MKMISKTVSVSTPKKKTQQKVWCSSTGTFLWFEFADFLTIRPWPTPRDSWQPIFATTYTIHTHFAKQANTFGGLYTSSVATKTS